MHIPLLTKLNTTAQFLVEAVNRPKQVGAIMPSSPNLAAAMASWLPAESETFVVELGPGTGAVTQALIERGLPQERLVAVEKSSKLADVLRGKFPQVSVITGDALELDSLLGRSGLDRTRIGMVVSSLPLLNFEPAMARRLAGQIHTVLRPAGTLVQFSYHLGRHRGGALERFERIASRIIWWNLPPARVTVYRR